MNPKTLKADLIEEIRILPAKDVYSVAGFVEFIREKEIEEEILNSKKLIQTVKRSKTAWKAGKKQDFVNWETFGKKQ